MNIDEMQAAIRDDKTLDEAFEKSEYASAPEEAVREGWKAWEWTRRQLVAKGVPEEHALAMRQLYMSKSRRMGTYAAIHACVFGEKDTATIIM